MNEGVSRKRKPIASAILDCPKDRVKILFLLWGEIPFDSPA